MSITVMLVIMSSVSSNVDGKSSTGDLIPRCHMDTMHLPPSENVVQELARDSLIGRLNEAAVHLE